MVGSITVLDNATDINNTSSKKKIVSMYSLIGKSGSYSKIIIITYNDGSHRKILNLDNLAF